MAHIKPTKDNPTHRFVCNRCGMVAGQNSSESEALKQARQVANMQKWLQYHPGWGFTCPSCLEGRS